MAGELQFSNGPGHTGDTIYFRLYNASGQIWNGSAFETFVDANIATYDITATEQGTASGLFVGDMPAVAAGVYSFDAWVQAGGAPAVGDKRAGTGVIQWDGSAEVSTYGAVEDALIAYNLDHLMKTAVGDTTDLTTEVADDTVLACIMASDADTSGWSKATDSLEAIRDTQATLGPGASANTYTVTDGSDPIDGVSVWVTTDEAGSNVIASGTSDDSGEVTFMLDAGTTYYIWRQKAGYNFTNPDTEEAA